MSMETDLKQYEEWAASKVDKSYPLCAGFPRSYLESPLAEILDHGMIVGGVCIWQDKVPELFEDITEFAVLSRPYVKAEDLTKPLPGLKHIVLPYSTENDLRVLTVITGVGRGADLLLAAASGMPIWELTYLLPQSMARTHHIRVQQGNDYGLLNFSLCEN